MNRVIAACSIVVVVASAALVPGSGRASADANGLPAGLAAAIHARLGAGAIRSSWAARAAQDLPPELGISVALSADGTTALVGAPNAGPDSTAGGCCHYRNGAAVVFHVSSAGSWSSSATPVATLKSNSALPIGVGYQVALSPDGTTAFVGAVSNGGIPTVFVFRVSAEDAWASSSSPTATLSVGDSDVGGLGRLAVSTDGTTLAVGAPYYDGHNSTAAFIFHVSSESAWATTSTPTAVLSSDCCGGDAVAISGDGTTVLLGDAGDSSTGGGAFLFHVAAEDAWASTSTPTATLTDASSSTDPFADLGSDLALSGDGTVAFLSAPQPGVNIAGYVDVFRASGEANWVTTSTPDARLTAGFTGGLFGWTVAVSNDGTTALVTAPYVHAYRGAAYVFHAASAGAWASTSAPTATLIGQRRGFLGAGGTLSSDGATALLGAPGVHFDTGAADVFQVSDASSWASSSAPTAILTNSAYHRCVVPNLKGLKVRAARSALRARSCRLGRVSRFVHVGARRGHVFSQSKRPGWRLPVGTNVGINVAK